MTTPLAVGTPTFWWRMAAAEAHRWVATDPDVDDGRQRHEDRDRQNWAAISAVVSEVGDALAAGAWTVEEDSESIGYVVIDGHPNGLSETEQIIITSWFRSYDAVRVDPWFDQLTNGRHRLWSTIPHFGHKSVPLCGDALGYANADDVPVLGAAWSNLFEENLRDLDALTWFEETDPLNVRFRQSIAAAAAGKIPSPT